MNTIHLIEQIAQKDVNITEFVQLAIKDESVRDEIVRQMLTNTAIMVYYHCYYVVEQASQERPELFYAYWTEIAALLHHPNSYHRDFALEILGNLAVMDRENRFTAIAAEYFGIVNDEKFMTGNCCVKNLRKIYRYKPEQRDRIVEILLDIDHRCNYSEKQKGVLKADVLEIFEEIHEETSQRHRIDEFIKAQVGCISPKTRKKAKELMRKYGL